MDINEAHKHSIRNRAEIEASDTCGCFYCQQIFSPREIAEWVDEGGVTALCPRCDIDSVIGSAAGAPINAEFLGKMHKHWFQGPTNLC